MPDLRFDPISAQWVAIAANRANRPMEFEPFSDRICNDTKCPFCNGNEDETPPALELWDHEGQLAETPNGSTQWSARVVPNKFPSFPSPKIVRPYDTTVLPNDEDVRPYQRSRSAGVQELIIPSPRHVCSFAELTEQEAKVALMANQHRISVLDAKSGIRHAMLFLNRGSAAGASLSHVHWQLIGSPVISNALRDRVERNRQHFDENQTTLLAAMLEWEQQQRARIVLETEHFCVLCPFASRVPFQSWIVPRQLPPSFAQCPADMRDELALLCRKILQRLEQIQEHVAYNVMLHAAPFELNQNDHWYVEILPRLTRAAGLEMGTDVWVNPVSPEDAARKLRHS